MDPIPESGAVTPQQNSKSLAEILDTVPGLATRLKRLRQLEIDDALRERDSIRAMLLKSVEKSLATKTKDGTGTWMLELAGFNHHGDKMDDAEFIATLLLDQAIEQPWIIEGTFIDNVAHILGSQQDARPKFHTASLCTSHPDCHTLQPLVQRHGSRLTDSQELTAEALVYTVTLPQSPRELGQEQIEFNVDSHLGIAGVIPLKVRELLHAGHREGVASSSKNEAVFKETFLREFRDHVNLELLDGTNSSYRARVSFQSESGQPQMGQPFDATWQTDKRMGQLLDRIFSMIHQLERTLILCQANGKCLLGIPFLNASTTEDPEDEVLAMEMLPIPDVEKFFQSFKKLKATSRHGDNNVVAFDVASLAMATGIWVGAPLLGAALVQVGLGAASFFLSSRASVHATVSKSLATVFRAIGVEFIGTEGEESIPVILHYSSLAVQCISLALQSSARGFASPLDFSFLDLDVAEFILEGANMGQKIFATLQPLTCLSGMLGESVLVFGASPRNQSAKMDLVASVKDALSVWGPGKLELVGRVLAGDNSPSYSIAKIYIGGGRLRPYGESKSLLPLWHWESVDACGDVTPWGYQSHDSIDLDTKVRIGVLDAASPVQVSLAPTPLALQRSEYPGAFTPIGPSSENRSCPHAREESDSERRTSMSTYIEEIGTHESYYEPAGLDFGAQGGQYFLFQGMRRWDKKPARVVKDILLDETQSPIEFIKRLDDSCGLFVSCCTRVMARARLRDLVAFTGPLVHPELFPCLEDLSQEASMAVIIEALQGMENFLGWASAQHDNSGKILRDSAEFKGLILGVLRRLRSTGITPTHCFEVAWISPRQSSSVRASCGSDPWLYLFKDGQFTATFACVTPLCLETRFDRCASRHGKNPQCSFSNGFGNFALSTRVLPYQSLPGGHVGHWQANSPASPNLEVGRSYFLNSAKVKLVASVSEPFELAYKIKVKESKVTAVILKRVVARRDARFIRESNGYQAIPCLISGED